MSSIPAYTLAVVNNPTILFAMPHGLAKSLSKSSSPSLYDANLSAAVLCLILVRLLNVLYKLPTGNALILSLGLKTWVTDLDGDQGALRALLSSS